MSLNRRQTLTVLAISAAAALPASAAKAVTQPQIADLQVRAYSPLTNATQIAASKPFTVVPNPQRTAPDFVAGQQPSAPPTNLTPDRPTHR